VRLLEARLPSTYHARPPKPLPRGEALRLAVCVAPHRQARTTLAPFRQNGERPEQDPRQMKQPVEQRSYRDITDHQPVVKAVSRRYSPSSCHAPRIALGLRQHVLRVHGNLLRFDNAHDALVEPRGVIGGTVRRVLFFLRCRGLAVRSGATPVRRAWDRCAACASSTRSPESPRFRRRESKGGPSILAHAIDSTRRTSSQASPPAFV